MNYVNEFSFKVKVFRTNDADDAADIASSSAELTADKKDLAIGLEAEIESQSDGKCELTSSKVRVYVKEENHINEKSKIGCHFHFYVSDNFYQFYRTKADAAVAFSVQLRAFAQLQFSGASFYGNNY